MECPHCGKTDSKVIDSRLAKDGATIRRRRHCLACSNRFTTYESTKQGLVPFLIRQNAGGGASIPNARTILSIVSNTLTAASEDTERLMDKADKLDSVDGSKGKTASGKSVPAKKRPKSQPSTEQLARILKGHIQGAQAHINENGLSLDQAVRDYEKTLILEALDKTNWVKAKAARLLSVNRTTLVEKIKKQKLTQTPST